MKTLGYGRMGVFNSKYFFYVRKEMSVRSFVVNRGYDLFLGWTISFKIIVTKPDNLSVRDMTLFQHNYGDFWRFVPSVGKEVILAISSHALNVKTN